MNSYIQRAAAKLKKNENTDLGVTSISRDEQSRMDRLKDAAKVDSRARDALNKLITHRLKVARAKDPGALRYKRNPDGTRRSRAV